jgi:hypothetical protein
MSGSNLRLRVLGEQAVLSPPEGRHALSDRDEPPIQDDLAEALQEWARVAVALRTSGGQPDAETAAVVSQRGRQLAARVAASTGAAVDYVDPVTGVESVVTARLHGRRSFAARLLGQEPRRDLPAPWGTGLTVAAFVAVVLVVAMLALADTLASETTGWVATGAALVVTAGLAPSLWLARRLPVLRWVVLGTAAGLTLSWVGVLVIAMSA